MTKKKNMKYIIGLDLSKCSPAMAIYNLCENTWHIYGFAKRKDEEGAHATGNPKVFVECWPKQEKEQDVVTYITIENCMFKAIDSCISRDTEPNDVFVVIENYAFVPGQAGSSCKLHEVGGIIKRAFYVRTVFQVFPISVTSWKKLVLGYGFATKKQSLDHIAAHGPQVNLMQVLNMKHLEKNGDPPNPAQDMADACNLVLGVLQMFQTKDWSALKPKNKRKKHKRQKKQLTAEDSDR